MNVRLTSRSSLLRSLLVQPRLGKYRGHSLYLEVIPITITSRRAERFVPNRPTSAPTHGGDGAAERKPALPPAVAANVPRRVACSPSAVPAYAIERLRSVAPQPSACSSCTVCS